MKPERVLPAAAVAMAILALLCTAAVRAAEPATAESMRREVRIDEDPKAPAPPAGPIEKPGETPVLKPGQKVMELDEIRDLPVLRRYDPLTEKGQELLADVKDYTFDYDESSFWWIVDMVARMPKEAFTHDDMPTGYPQLLSMPTSFRGQPVTIRGAYMSVTPFRTPVLAIRKNVPVLYEVNLRELPLTEERPVATVIVLEDPMTYLKVFDTVRVTGYFYKVRRYKGNKGEGFAPMLVARRLDYEEPGGSSFIHYPDEAGGKGGGPTLLLAVPLVMAVLILGGVFIYMRQRTKAKSDATNQHPMHRFNLRRPDRTGTPGGPGPGNPGDSPRT